MNEIQEHELFVLEEVAKVCERHGLRYFAIGGTCIGALRHHGFIPWDDDIDIGMPRDDYEAFCSVYSKELPEYLQLLSYRNESQFPYLFTKVHDLRTTLIGAGFYGSPELYTGVFVDIMPIDGFPKIESNRNLLNRVALYSWLYYKSRNLRSPGSGVKRMMKRCMRAALGVVFRGIDFPLLVNRALSDYSFDTTSNCLFTWRVYDRSLSENRLVFPSEWFRDVELVPFETTMIPVPIGAHDYLSSDFGEYMELPPEESRISGHDIMIADMNRSYKMYLDEPISESRLQ